MHEFATKVLWIYIILLLVGGLIGFFKAKSKMSLITSVVFAVLLALTTLRGVFQPQFARIFATILLAALGIVFTIRFVKTNKFMPSGLMLVLTFAVLALWNLEFH